RLKKSFAGWMCKQIPIPSLLWWMQLFSSMRIQKESGMLHPTIEKLEQNPDFLKAHWCLPREDARFLYLLARIGRFRQLLEVGTSIGYSTLHLALAVSQGQGRVTSIDASEP